MRTIALHSCIATWLFLAVTQPCLAAAPSGEGLQLPLLKVGADYYTNITVTSVTATDIYFSHSRGVGNAKLKNLSSDLQAKFDFDPVKAAEKAREQNEANAEYRQALKNAPKPRPVEAEIQVGESSTEDEIPPHDVTAKSFLNQPAPLILADKWLTAQPELKGKFVLLDFWATWCGPCKRSIPHLNELAAKFKDRLIVIGLSDESEEIVRKMKEPRMEYFVAIDTAHRSSLAVGVSAIPHALLIDPSGIVRFEGHPGLLETARLEKLLNRFAAQ